MINFVLPDFFMNFTINTFLIASIKEHPERLKAPINIWYTSGNFPYTIWNGGINNNFGELALYNAYLDCPTKYPIPLRFNCANVCLEDSDFWDRQMNMILELNQNGTHSIEVSNLDLMNYINDNFENYKFVFSKQADLIKPFSIDIINAIIGFDKFEIISLPDRLNRDFDFIKSLDKKHVIELTVNPPCPKYCRNYNNCAIIEHENQLEYSSISMINNCQKNIFCRSDMNNIITIEEIQEKYLPLGINHFTFSSLVNLENPMSIAGFYIQYFFKPEYYFDLLLSFAEELNRHG